MYAWDGSLSVYFYSRSKTTRNVTWGTSRSATNWRAARAAPCTWTASGTSGSRSARHYLVRGHCCSQLLPNSVNLLCLCQRRFVPEQTWICFIHARSSRLAVPVQVKPDVISAVIGVSVLPLIVLGEIMTLVKAQWRVPLHRAVMSSGLWGALSAGLNGPTRDFTVTCTLTMLLLLAGLLP